ncbi:MAG: glycosyltransferase [Paracoccaceae bacterium]
MLDGHINLSSTPKSCAANSQDEVCILLGLFQGAEFLGEQLNSFVAQHHQNWSVLGSDDGSTDGTRAVFEQFALMHPTQSLSYVTGPGKGFARNFLSLLCKVPAKTPYAAFSDQDDVWFPEKLSRAVGALANVPSNQPALYCAGTLVCDRDLSPLGVTNRFRTPPGFRNALVQSIAGGNTMVLNRAAIDLAQAAATATDDSVSHDWWLYQLISGCGGTVICDPSPVLFYRQHGGNLVGASLGATARLNRLFAVLNGQFRTFNSRGYKALCEIEHMLSPDARKSLHDFAMARAGSLPMRLWALRRSGVYRQTWIDTVALYAACVLNRL